jgi:hypothetical protein
VLVVGSPPAIGGQRGSIVAPRTAREFAQFPGSIRAARLTSPFGKASISVREMEDRNLFISSCSRRQLARRKPTRSTGTWPLTIMMLALVVAVAAVLATRGIV